MPKSKFCFYCSRVRMRNYEKPTYFLDIIVDERDFEERFRKMVRSYIDLDTREERPITFDYPKFNIKCDFHEQICTTRCLLEAFTNVLVRMLEDEKKLTDNVYTYASDLMYQF